VVCHAKGMAAGRKRHERPRIMIWKKNCLYGIGLADCLATHGYQPILVRSVEAGIEELVEIRPQAVAVGLL